MCRQQPLWNTALYDIIKGSDTSPHAEHPASIKVILFSSPRLKVHHQSQREAKTSAGGRKQSAKYAAFWRSAWFGGSFLWDSCVGGKEMSVAATWLSRLHIIIVDRLHSWFCWGDEDDQHHQQQQPIISLLQVPSQQKDPFKGPIPHFLWSRTWCHSSASPEPLTCHTWRHPESNSHSV